MIDVTGEGCGHPVPVFDIRPQKYLQDSVVVYLNRHLEVEGRLVCTNGSAASDGTRLADMCYFAQIKSIFSPERVGDCLGCFGRYPEWMRT